MRGLFRAALCCLAVLVAAPAGAAEKLRVVKAVAFAWTFTPLDVGIEMGLFAKHGLEVEASAAAGDAKLQQALTADSADIGIGSGRGMPPARAAMKTNQIDGYIGALESGYALEEQKEWRVITSATPFVEQFITHVFFARDELIQKRPEVVRAFLRGWMDTIAYMKANKAKTVEITSKVINVPPSVAARAYDEQIGTFSTDGTFDPKAVAALKASFMEMALLKEVPA